MSILFPLYLLGLLGLLLPWLLHRFSHHEPQEQAFPSTRFLEPTKPPTTNRRRLRYWLLFALRSLFLALLCLLFAQPWLSSRSDAENAELVHLLIIDNSYSMRASNHWDNALEKVGEFVGALPENTAVQFYSFANQLVAQTDLVSDQSLLLSASKKLEPSFESADYGELMRYLSKVANDIDLPVSATFISDTQRSNLPLQVNSLLANGIEQFKVISVADNSLVNYSLRAEAITSDSINARIGVSIAASGALEALDSAVVTKAVEIVINGQVVDTQSVDVLAGEVKTIYFDAISVPSDIDELITVRFSEQDKLVEDDLVEIPVQGLSNIAVTMTSLGDKPLEQARVFAKTALETNGDVRVELLSSNAALAPHVRHAVVFANDVSKTPEVVSRFVMDGGNVLLLPIQSSGGRNTGSVANLSNIAGIDQAHPLGLGDVNWFETGFYSTPSLKVGDNDTVLLRLDSGTPLLIERELVGGGRLLVLNDYLDGLSSDLPLQPSFVVMLERIISYFNASNALPREIEVGQPLFLPANTQVLTPSGTPLFSLDQLGRTNNVNLSEPGVYSVLGLNSSDKVLVEHNPSESNLLNISKDELDAWEARHSPSSESAPSSTEAGNTSFALRDQTRSQQLLRWLIPLTLMLLLIETILANRMLWVRRGVE